MYVYMHTRFLDGKLWLKGEDRLRHNTYIPFEACALI
jgi:hypothetical protein